LKQTGSGKILEKDSERLLSYVYLKTKDSDRKYILVGCGGIFNAEDAYRKIKLGAKST
jgi:dihydroorotate dehydrogenase